MKDVVVRWLGKQDYHACWQAMQEFTNQRQAETLDEIWLLEHDPVFTQGQSGKAEHLLNPGHIPVVQTDRGGQITYHGPGQLMVYVLLDLKRKKFTIRDLVSHLEKSVCDFLASINITAYAKCAAPGVYLKQQDQEFKICSIGLRVRRGCSYHGIAFNVAMDLSPFQRINPCGFADLAMTQLADLGVKMDVQQAGEKLLEFLFANLGYRIKSSG